MARSFTWQSIGLSLSEGKIHEVPLNFTMEVNTVHREYGDSFRDLIGRVIHSLQRHGWAFDQNRDYSGRREVFTFEHQDPIAHAASALRAAGHSMPPTNKANMAPYQPPNYRSDTDGRAARIRRLEDISFFGDEVDHVAQDASMFSEALLRQMAMAAAIPMPSEEQRRMVMAATGITDADIDPSHPSGVRQVPLPAPSPTPPARKPLPIHVRCGVRKIDRGTTTLQPQRKD